MSLVQKSIVKIQKVLWLPVEGSKVDFSYNLSFKSPPNLEEKLESENYNQ